MFGYRENSRSYNSKSTILTSEEEAAGRRKRDFHEMGVLELAVSAEIVYNRDFSVCSGGSSTSRRRSHGEFGPGFVSRVRAGF